MLQRPTISQNHSHSDQRALAFKFVLNRRPDSESAGHGLAPCHGPGLRVTMLRLV